MKKLVLLTLFVLAIALFSTGVQAKEVLATIDDIQITDDQVMSLANTRMMKIQAQMYSIKRAALEQLVQETLLVREAKKQGISVDKLEQNITAKAGEVTEAEARVIFDMNKKYYKGKEFGEVKEQLMAKLKSQKENGVLGEYIEGLRKAAKIKINLERPRANVSVDDDPGQGNKNATVTIIEFSDFQCPYCKRVRPTLNRIMQEYKDKVYYVFRDYPLSFHQLAKDASNAANCAHEQGKYWEYSNKIWEGQRTLFDKKLSKEDFYKQLKDMGQALSLNMSNFNTCVDSHRYFKEIDKDMADGIDVGVSGTPSYFVNGVY
ncbi:MAG: thioredoxin domain-containing protein, partial [bacterium]|nr:thioredoxin domain-containing protein [bacterium]